MDEVDSYILSILMAKRYKSLLEVGCGYGVKLNMIRLYLPQIKVMGVDIAQKYIDEAKKYFKGIKLVVKDINKLLVGKRFDVGFSHGFFIHVPHENIRRMIRKVMGMAKEGLFIESSGQEQKRKLKYDPSKYWNHRAVYPDEKDDLPMQYYYSHDYENLFNGLGYKYQIIKEFDRCTKTRIFLVWGK